MGQGQKSINRSGARMSEKQYRDKIAQITKEEATERSNFAKATTAASKFRGTASSALGKITRNTSASMTRTHQRAAEAAENSAVKEDAKAAKATGKLAQLAKDSATARTNLERAEQATARKTETQRRQATQVTQRERQAEKSHAREVARLTRPEVRYIHEVRVIPEAKQEPLRVLYMTTNSDMDLRTEAEVRAVQQAVRGALHRDLIEITYRPSATPEDLLDGLNDLRPHVVHFSGHAGDAALLFDNGDAGRPAGRGVPYDLLAAALSATDTPPALLLLNGCDTLKGADVLLNVSATIIATADSIGDVAAAAFAARFYAAVASGQSVGAAVNQGKAAIGFLGLTEGWKHEILSRDDLDPNDQVLVRVQELDIKAGDNTFEA